MISRATLIAAVRKLDPREMVRNPVMFVVELGAVLTTVLWIVGEPGQPGWFAFTVAVWLWLTVLFGNLAEAIAEGRGKAQAATLRAMRKDTVATLRARVQAAEHRLLPEVVTVDSRERVAAFRGVTACTPNQEEVERALRLPAPPSARTIGAAARALLKRTGNEAVLITRGAAGMVLLEPGAAPVAIPAFGAGEVADVTGAGDTVIAVFTLARASGASPEEAATLANVAAGLVVMKYGTATLTPRELLRALADGPAS